MEWIPARWPAPSWIRAYTSTRLGGISQPPYETLNLADHVGDNLNNVAINRLICQQYFNWQHNPIWLNQSHSNKIYLAKESPKHPIDADGSITQMPNLPCVVLTADCLPLLICDTQGTIVAAVHCGWRGIQTQIIEQTLLMIRQHTQQSLLAWIGPCIGSACYEVGEEIKEKFVNLHPIHATAFYQRETPGKFLADLPKIVANTLRVNNVYNIHFSENCTYRDALYFYSYRRNNVCGRMATFIWLDL